MSRLTFASGTGVPLRRILTVAFVLALLASPTILVAGCSSGSDGDEAIQIATATRPTASSPTARPTLRPTAPAEPAGTATPSPSTLEPSPIPPIETPADAPPVETPVAAPQVQLSPDVIGQGEASMVRLWGYMAPSAMAVFNERRYPLVADGEFFWGILAAGVDQPAGDYPVVIQLYQANGALLGELQTQIGVVAMDYPEENIDLPPESTALLTPELAQEEANIRASTFALFTAQKLWAGVFIYPVDAIIVSPYGIGRSYNGGPVSSHHGGVDLAAEEGVPVVASNSGRVAYAGPAPIRGNSVIIDHGAGVFSGYHHLSAIAVQVGQMVNKGDLVGNAGSTGMVTGPHLHWEVIVRGVEIDPIPWTLEEKGP